MSEIRYISIYRSDVCISCGTVYSYNTCTANLPCMTTPAVKTIPNKSSPTLKLRIGPSKTQLLNSKMMTINSKYNLMFTKEHYPIYPKYPTNFNENTLQLDSLVLYYCRLCTLICYITTSTFLFAFICIYYSYKLYFLLMPINSPTIF